MSIAYVPSSLGWQPVERPSWSSGGFNTDRATVLWRGPATKREVFLAGLEAQQWGSLPSYTFAGTLAWAGFPLMFLETWNESGSSPSFSGQVLNYVGFKTQAIPDAKSKDDTSIQTANASGTFDGDVISGTFTYIASRTTWEWFETSQPNRQNPRYRTVNQPVNPLSNVQSYSLKNSAGDNVNTLTTAQVGAAFNSLSPQTQVVFSAENIVPGKLWACTATVDFILQ